MRATKRNSSRISRTGQPQARTTAGCERQGSRPSPRRESHSPTEGRITGHFGTLILSGVSVRRWGSATTSCWRAARLSGSVGRERPTLADHRLAVPNTWALVAARDSSPTLAVPDNPPRLAARGNQPGAPGRRNSPVPPAGGSSPRPPRWPERALPNWPTARSPRLAARSATPPWWRSNTPEGYSPKSPHSPAREWQEWLEPVAEGTSRSDR